jgi:hypothetical protein
LTGKKLPGEWYGKFVQELRQRLDALRAMREANFANLAQQENGHGESESKRSRRLSTQ